MALTYSADEAAEIIGGISGAQLIRWGREGKILVVKLGRSYRYTYEAIEAFIADQQAINPKRLLKSV